MTLLEQFQGDVHAVLRYAFRTSARPIIAGSSLFRQMMSTGIKVAPGKMSMTAHDDHAQAAAIMLAIDSLGPIEQAVIYGWHDGTKREAAIATLLPLVPRPGVMHERIIEMLVREWLDTDGRKVGRHLKRTQRQLVDDGTIPRAYSSTQLSYARKAVFEYLNAIDLRAKEQLAARWSR